MQIFNIQNSTLAAFIFLFIPLKSNFHCTLPKCGNPSHAVVLERQMGVPFFFLVTCDCKSRILLFLHRLVFLVVVGRREMRKQAHLCPLFCQEIGKTRYINHYYQDFLSFLLAFFAIIQTRNNIMFFGKQVCNCIITNRQSNDDVLND